MTLGIANTYSNTVDNTSGTATCAITRAAGEGLLFGYWYDYDFGAPSAIASATWDPSGDNQALTLVALRQLELSGALENRYFALYQLKNPTSAKSGNVVIVHAGTTLSRGAFLCRNIIDFDPVTWITAFNSRTEANPLTNDLPNTVNSASGELGVFFGAMRNEVAYIAAGDLGSYAEQVVLAGSRSLFSGSKVSVGSTVSGTFTYDDPGTNYDNALIAVSIAPSSGGGGGPTPIVADQGSYSLTGQSANLLTTRKVFADFGTYSLTGYDATLTKATPGAYVLPADFGSYAWTGEAALADYAMNAEFGTYAISGQDAAFSRTFPQAYSLIAERGLYTITGRSARLIWSNAPVVPSRGSGLNMGMKIGL